MINKQHFNNNIISPDLEGQNFIKGRYDTAVQQSIDKAWTGVDQITTPEGNKIPPLTPEVIKQAHENPEPEGQGLIGKLIDGVSDTAMGLYSGVGYGIDETAVSAASLLNAVGESTGLYESPEYEAKYISNYMDGLQERGIAGDVAKSIGQFMIGWMPWTRGIGLLSKGMKAMEGTKKAGEFIGGATKGGKISANFLASSLTGATAFSPDHDNIANMIQGMDGYTKGAVTEFFATNPNDPEWKNRLRNAMQEGGFSLLGDTVLVPAVKGIGGAIKDVASDPMERLIAGLGVAVSKSAMKTRKAYRIVRGGKASISIDDGVTKVEMSTAQKDLNLLHDKLTIPKGKNETAEQYLAKLGRDDSLEKKFGEARTLEEKAILADDIAAKLTEGRKRELGTVEVGNIKWDKTKTGFKTVVNKQKWSIRQNKDGQWVLKRGTKNVDLPHPTLDDAKKAMGEAAKVALKKTIPRRNNEQLMRESKALFEDVGLDADSIKGLPDNMAWNDTQLYAFGRLVQSTEKEMFDALKQHAAVASNDANYKMLEATALSKIANHADALTFLSGAKTATGRAMAAVKGVNKMQNQTIHADHIGSPEIASLMRAGKLGGHEISRMTEMILHAYQTNGKQMGASSLISGIGKNEGGFWNQFVEAWINQGLLSNPATHALNTFSGMTNIAGHIGSQITSAFISKLPFVENKVLFREAFGSIYGVMAGMTKAFRLSARASLTNEQIVTKSTKIENYGFKHLAAEHVGKGIGGSEDTAIGLGIDLLGSINRIPGRFLLMEDEFVKSIAYDMNLHSKAWKYAWSAQDKNNKGWLTTKTLYRDIVDNPKMFEDELGGFHQQGQELSNLITFQKEVGSMVNQLSGMMQDHPYLKLFVPFLKVLTNIPKYVIQHSPVGLVAQNDQFKKGGSARMLEMGRMAYGTMLMMYGGHLYNNGNLKGTGSRNFHEKMNKQNLGLDQAMSLKLKRFNGGDDTWVDIGRLAPVVNLLGLGADMAKGINTHDRHPDEVAELVWQSVSSVQKNLVSGTWAPNLHKLLGVLADDRAEGKDYGRALLSIVGTLQPSYVRSYEKLKNPNRKNLSQFGLEGENMSTSTESDWSRIGKKFVANSSHISDEEANIYPQVNALGGIVRSHDETKGIPEILNNPLVSFFTFRKANDKPFLKHILGGSDDKVQAGPQGDDLELPLKPLSGKIKINGQSYKMTSEELFFYQRAIGTVKSEAGQTLEEAWEGSFNSETYKLHPNHVDGVNNDKVNIMTNIYNHYKKRAKNLTIYKFGIANKAQKVRDKFIAKADAKQRN